MGPTDSRFKLQNWDLKGPDFGKLYPTKALLRRHGARCVNVSLGAYGGETKKVVPLVS